MDTKNARARTAPNHEMAPITRTRFQNFLDDAEPEKAAERLAALRRRMIEQGLDAFVLVRSDPWQNEYLRACDERLAWLTGFTGSAGLLTVLADAAALFVDGRYTIQAKRQVDATLFEILQVPETKPAVWLAERLATSTGGERGHARVGYDPWLMTAGEAVKWQEVLAEKAGADFVPTLPNPVDEIWSDRPSPPSDAFFLQPERLAGRSVTEKLALVREAMREKKATAALITLADSVSWLFNIRGRDIPHTPVALAFAWVPKDGPARLFATPEKVPDSVRESLESVAEVMPIADLERQLSALAGESGLRVLVDRDHAAARLVTLLTEAGAEIVGGDDPCLLPKAEKTREEQEGMRAAHLRDGVALCRFLAWLEEAAARGGVDEIAAAAKLETLRIDTADTMGEGLFDISFDTISATGANGAVVHYRVTTHSNRPLRPGDLYLIDSGGQYRDGTTDVTRTVFIGPPGMAPTAVQKRHFTLVLKGMIALSMVRFPEGISGANLDALARRALWAVGLDYDHGTGHGVGAFLSVHEGPQRIARTGAVALRPGMITSNEPGYYREGHYGIRIENLILCREPERRPGEGRAMLSFETLTLAPIDRRLIEAEMLGSEERAWLDGYHAQVRERVGPYLERLDPTAAEWLKQACAPL